MKNTRIALIVAGLSALGPFSVDTYFPSFPAIAAHFQVNEMDVQSTLTFYLMALAAMNLFHGSLSDAFGRRRVILIALVIYAATAFACATATGFGALLALRVVQGLAAGAGMIVGRAVVRDCLEGPEAQRSMAQITMVGALGPVIAPILGGWLHVGFGWRGPFVFLGFLGMALWWVCRVGLPETLALQARQPFHPGRLLRAYGQAMGNSSFVLLCVTLGLSGGGFLLYIATAPDVALNILGLSETQFGWLFLPIVSGFIIGSAVMSKLAGRVASERLVGWGFVSMAIGALANLAVNGFFVPRAPWAVLPITAYTFGFSLMAPVVTIQGLDLLPDRKGLASSLQGFAHIVVFAVVSALAAPLVYRSGIKHAAGLALLMSLSCAAYYATRIRPSSSVRELPLDKSRPAQASPAAPSSS